MCVLIILHKIYEMPVTEIKPIDNNEKRKGFSSIIVSVIKIEGKNAINVSKRLIK